MGISLFAEVCLVVLHAAPKKFLLIRCEHFKKEQGVSVVVSSSNYLPLNPSFPHRPRVDALLSEMCTAALVTVAAPPGYGKSHALASYACSESGRRRRTLWVGMPRLDGSKERFWRCLMESAGSVLRSLARRLAKIGFPDSPAAFEAFRSALDAESRRQPILLVVDDCDRIASEEVTSFLEYLVEDAPARFCIALTASNTSALARYEKLTRAPFPRRLTADHLRLTGEEAEDMARQLGTGIQRYEIDRILEETEGWPLAFALTCRERQRADGTVTVSSLLLSHLEPLFEDYCFEGLDARIRQDQIRLAFSPVFSMDIAREIAPHDIAELRKALRKNPFVTRIVVTNPPLELIRFHNMYRNFLLSQAFSLDREECETARIAAAAWFRSQGMAREAIEGYGAAGKYDLALEVLEEAPREERKDALFAQYVIGFLERLPDSYGDKAAIDLSRAFYYMNNMEIEKAEDILLAMVSRLDSADVREGAIMGEAYAALADIALLKNGSRYADFLKRAAALLPDGSRIQSKSIMALGNNALFFTPTNAPGEVERMVRLIFECAPLSEKVYNGRGCGYEWLFSGEAAYLTLDMERAKENCYRAIYRGDASEQYDIVCNARYVLARVALFCGELSEAEGHLSEISSYVKKHGLVELYELRDTAWGWFYLAMGDDTKVAPWIAEGRESGYVKWPTPSRRRSLIRAQYLKSVRNYHEAIALAAQVESALPQEGMCIPGMLATVLRAECHLRLGDRERAVEALHAAYTRSSATRAILPFVELGNTMRTLIDNARRLDNGSFDPAWLDNVQQRAGAVAKSHASLMETYRRTAGIKTESGISLTNREREVLGFLAHGMTREEIGDCMAISVNGVKKHVSGIYNKLGALNRADAVRIATDRGMI